MTIITSVEQLAKLADGEQFIIDIGVPITPENFDDYLTVYNQIGEALKTRKPKHKKATNKNSKNART